jgi:signal peptide peptidase SppA
MKLAKILTLLTSEPLFCSNEYRAALLEIFQQHASLGREEYKLARTGKVKSGSDLEVEQMEIEDGIAVIPIGGPVAIGLGEFEKGAGAVDMDDIQAEIADCEQNNEVESIILNFDCPGGSVQGTPETGARILACEKPIYAYTRGTMASAAYWLASSCNGIFASPSATVGNIGVALVVNDLSKMAEMQGVKVKVFASAPIKGIGTPGTSLSLQQESFLQARVMELAKSFYDHVSTHRSSIADDDMQGQFFTGQTALDKGFIDGIMSNIGELKSFLS